jgi:hypothetical protein
LRPIDVKTLKTKDRRALTQHLEQLIRSELKL